jgi:hypothetical protein
MPFEDIRIKSAVFAGLVIIEADGKLFIIPIKRKCLPKAI